MPVMTCKKCKTFGDCSGDICPACGAVMNLVPSKLGVAPREIKKKAASKPETKKDGEFEKDDKE